MSAIPQGSDWSHWIHCWAHHRTVIGQGIQSQGSRERCIQGRQNIAFEKAETDRRAIGIRSSGSRQGRIQFGWGRRTYPHSVAVCVHRTRSSEGYRRSRNQIGSGRSECVCQGANITIFAKYRQDHRRIGYVDFPEKYSRKFCEIMTQITFYYL